jgi:hypothetical protein
VTARDQCSPLAIVTARSIDSSSEAMLKPRCARITSQLGSRIAVCHVGRVTRSPFDRFGKQMVRTAFEDMCAVETDAEVVVDPRRIDLWFTPVAACASLPHRLDLGLLGRITDRAGTIEFFHNTPTGKALASCMVKHGDFRHSLLGRKPPPPPPTQWVISSGRPEKGIMGLAFRPTTRWPQGVYSGPRLMWTRLVVVNELPVERDTLLLRLLGAGAVLKHAIAELQALPPDALERRLALPILISLRLAVPTDPALQSSDDKEFLMHTYDLAEAWRREAVQEGREEGRASSVIDIYEARFDAMPTDLRAIVEATHDEETLRSWLRLAGTRDANEVAAAIRAFQAR